MVYVCKGAGVVFGKCLITLLLGSKYRKQMLHYICFLIYTLGWDSPKISYKLHYVKLFKIIHLQLSLVTLNNATLINSKRSVINN